MSTVNVELAVRAAEENNTLRLCIARLEAEERDRSTLDRATATLDTSAVDKMRGRNEALRVRLVELDHRLAELRSTNMTEVYHQYLHWSSRRGQLLSEIAGLRNIIANQSRDVQRASQNVSRQKELRKQTEEQNAMAKANAQLFAEKQEGVQRQIRQLTKEEMQLRRQIEELPQTKEDCAVEIRRLHNAIAKEAESIAQLEHELRLVRSDEAEDSIEVPVQHARTELSQLREEYVKLKEQLNELQE